MARKESRIYSWVTTQLKKFHAQRIETSTTPGIPDYNLIVDGTEVWMEVKAYQKRTDGHVYLRKEQYAWMKRRAALGGVCLVLNKDEMAWDLWIVDQFDQAVPSREGYVILAKQSSMSGQGAHLLMEAIQLAVVRVKK